MKKNRDFGNFCGIQQFVCGQYHLVLQYNKGNISTKICKEGIHMNLEFLFGLISGLLGMFDISGVVTFIAGINDYITGFSMTF